MLDERGLGREPVNKTFSERHRASSSVDGRLDDGGTRSVRSRKHYCFCI